MEAFIYHFKSTKYKGILCKYTTYNIQSYVFMLGDKLY